MHVAVIGAGALGAVHGARLSARAGAAVTFVVRPAAAASRAPIAIERVRDGERIALEAPERAAAVPPDADVVLVAVGTEDLGDLPLDASSAPLVFLTPALPADWARLRRRFGDRAHAAMPSVVAYTRDDGVVRYWAPPAPTKIDEPRAASPHATVIRELAAALGRAGLRGRLDLGVHEANPATTVAFIALPMAIAVAGGVDALAADATLLALAADACREGARLSPRLGTAEPWAAFAPLLTAPSAVRAGVALLRRLSPEGLRYADVHFGRKLRAQHRAMAWAMVDLCRDRDLPHAALAALAARLDA